jgi:hypothetical protein
MPLSPGSHSGYDIQRSGVPSPPLPHAPTHIHGGTDEIDGDRLDIDFVPLYYTPDPAGGGVASTQELAAHLAGIDNELPTFLTEPEHEALDTLIHDIAESFDEEVNYNGSGDVDRITFWVTGSGRTVKIREALMVYVGSNVSTVTTTQYDALGVAIVGQTLTETFTYNAGGDVITITGVES